MSETPDKVVNVDDLANYTKKAANSNNITSRLEKPNFIRNRILGLPASYTSVTDYNRRAYDATILADFPILNMTPGILKYRTEAKFLFNSLRNLVASDLLPIETDGRRVYFKYAYPEYTRYLNILAGSVFGRMMNVGASAAYVTIQQMLELQEDSRDFFTDIEPYMQEYASFSGDINLKELNQLVAENNAIQQKLIDENAGIIAASAGSSDIAKIGLQNETITKAAYDGLTDETKKLYKVDKNDPNTYIDIKKAADNKAKKDDAGVDKLAKFTGPGQQEEANPPKDHPGIRTYGLSYFVDPGTNSSESIDNSYTESEMEKQSKALQDEMREIRFSMSQRNVFGKVAEMAKKIPDLISRAGAVFTTEGAASAIMRGARMQFPKVFEDNSFSRTYSISFRFASPYGDKYSIFQYVYLPMLSLLAFVLPRQVGLSTYIAPFLVKADFPGNFAVDMGVVTRMSIEKNADSNSWSIDGLPLQMNVTIDLMDLYPVMMMARNAKLINQSVSMAVYLNNLAGLSMDVDNPIGRFFESRYDRFLSRINWIKDTAPRTIDNVKRKVFFDINQTFRM
jgi:hypothetical protein